MYTFLGYTQNHIKVVYDPEHSHVVSHFADTPQLKELVREVLSMTIPTGDDMWFETDLQRVVGLDDLVETDEHDEIVYAKRAHRHTYTRFTKTKKAQPSTIVTVAMNPLDDETYELKSAWIGASAYMFPDDPNAVPESREFWEHHAIAWGTQNIQPDTMTTICPW